MKYAVPILILIVVGLLLLTTINEPAVPNENQGCPPASYAARCT